MVDVLDKDSSGAGLTGMVSLPRLVCCTVDDTSFLFLWQILSNFASTDASSDFKALCEKNPLNVRFKNCGFDLSGHSDFVNFCSTVDNRELILKSFLFELSTDFLCFWYSKVLCKNIGATKCLFRKYLYICVGFSNACRNNSLSACVASVWVSPSLGVSLGRFLGLFGRIVNDVSRDRQRAALKKETLTEIGEMVK